MAEAMTTIFNCLAKFSTKKLFLIPVFSRVVLRQRQWHPMWSSWRSLSGLGTAILPSTCSCWYPVVCYVFRLWVSFCTCILRFVHVWVVTDRWIGVRASFIVLLGWLYSFCMDWPRALLFQLIWAMNGVPNNLWYEYVYYNIYSFAKLSMYMMSVYLLRYYLLQRIWFTLDRLLCNEVIWIVIMYA